MLSPASTMVSTDKSDFDETMDCPWRWSLQSIHINSEQKTVDMKQDMIALDSAEGSIG